MNSPQALHHSLLRPCVLHILRATGYHSTRPSVLDTLTDLTARYLALLAQSTVMHASLGHIEPELALEVSIQNVRMAMQDCGTLGPEAIQEEQIFDEIEDTRGVDEFILWATGPKAQEMRRIALEGNEDNYLTSDEESKYASTVLGKDAEPRAVKIEGSEINHLKEWRSQKKPQIEETFIDRPRRHSSVPLGSVGEVIMESLEF